MLRPLLIACALLALTSTAFAAPAAKPATKAKPALVCPVTGETIASVKDAVGSSVYKGKKYYFCCESCKPSFDKDPAKYVKTASAVKPTQAH